MKLRRRDEPGLDPDALYELPVPPMSEEDYVRACVILANHPSAFPDSEVPLNVLAPDASLIAYYLSVMRNKENFVMAAVINEACARSCRTAAHELREELRKALYLAAADLSSALKNQRSKIDVMLDGISVATELHLRPDGRLEHRHRYQPKDHEAAIALLWVLLLDPSLPFGQDLRVCALDDCDRFFLATKNPAGGPRPKYCSSEHATTADNRKAAKRVAKFRKGTRKRRKKK